jgi:hypothetical protein
MGNLDYEFYAPTGRVSPGDFSADAYTGSSFEKDGKLNADLQQAAYNKDVKDYNDSQQKLQHLTWIFNTFVFLQIFNYINCRKVGDKDFNVLEKFFHNKFFLGILVFTFSFQYILTNVFSSIAGCKPLDKGEWGACLVVGSTPLLISVLLKLTPGSWVDRIPTDNLANENARKKSIVVDSFNAIQGAPTQKPKGDEVNVDVMETKEERDDFDDV